MTPAKSSRAERLLQLAMLRPRLFVAEIIVVGVCAYLSTFVIIAVLLGLFLLALACVIVCCASFFLLHLGLWFFRLFQLPKGVRLLWQAFIGPSGVPYGIPVETAEAPDLYAIIERIRGAYRMPEIAGVRIVSAFEVQTIRSKQRGILGWRKDYLHIGLPVFHTLSRDELEALLAQHLGMRSSFYSRLSDGITPALNFWQRLKESFEPTKHWGWDFLELFYRWYLERLPDYWVVLAILSVLDADRHAVELTDAACVGRVLVNTTVAGAFLEKVYWPSIVATQSTSVLPPDNGISGMGRALHTELDSEHGKIWLNEALADSMFARGPMPTLFTRLTHLSVEQTFRGLSDSSSAEVLLGQSLQSFSSALDTEMRERLATIWRTAYSQRQSTQEMLVMLEERIASGRSLSDAEWMKYAELVEQQYGIERAIVAYRSLLLRFPGHIKSRFVLGRLLLAGGDAEGIEEIERAMKTDSSNVIEGVELIYRFLSNAKRFREADEVVARYTKAYETEVRRRTQRNRLAEEERVHLRFNDNYRHHALPSPRLERIRELIAELPGIRAAFLIRKEMHYMPERPIYVLGIIRRRALFGRSEEERILEQKILNDLSILGDFRLVILNERRNRPMRKIMENIPNALLFEDE